MIDPNKYGKPILDAMFNTKNANGGYIDDPSYIGKIDPAKRNRVEFEQDVYIALFTKLTTDGNSIEWEEPTASEYIRFKLTKKSPITEQPILKSAITDELIKITSTVEVIDEDGNLVMGDDGNPQTEKVEDLVLAAYVTNDDNIIFPEVSSDLTAWGNGHIAGFGLFSVPTGGEPFFWGEVKPDSDDDSGTSTDGEEGEDETEVVTGVDIAQNEVPIIRIGSFKITVT